jgi:hypothetical protein
MRDKLDSINSRFEEDAENRRADADAIVAQQDKIATRQANMNVATA